MHGYAKRECEKSGLKYLQIDRKLHQSCGVRYGRKFRNLKFGASNAKSLFGSIPVVFAYLVHVASFSTRCCCCGCCWWIYFFLLFLLCILHFGMVFSLFFSRIFTLQCRSLGWFSSRHSILYSYLVSAFTQRKLLPLSQLTVSSSFQFFFSFSFC